MILENKMMAAAIRSRNSWEKIAKYLDVKEFSPQNACVLELVDAYYERDATATSVDGETLLAQVTKKFSSNPKHEEMYITHTKELIGTNVSAINVTDLLVETKKDEIGRKLGIALINKQNTDKIPELIQQYEELTAEVLTEDDGEDEEEYNSLSVKDVISKTVDPNSLIKLLPVSLNDAVDGGCLRGHHIVLFARPETGKTAASVTLAYGFALQGLDVIYFGNEDPMMQIIQRAMSCFTGMDKQTLSNNPEKAQELLDKRGWQHLRFIPLSPGTPRDIEKYVARYKPDCIIVDQLRNLQVPGAGNKVEQLEEAAKASRRVAQRHKLLAVSVTQAGDSASNKLVLDMGDVDSSNTGIPGQADLMIGVGVNREYDELGMRMLSLPKNKISGKHVHFQAKINPTTSRIENA